VLNLASQTDPDWVERVRSTRSNLDAVLLDHAHCEKKAAGTAVNLLFRYPEHPFLQVPLSQLAREELVHFEQVVRRLEERGIAFERQKPSAYGGKLHRHVRPGEPERLLDVLLVAALIEARSCERFQRLAEALESDEPELAGLYRGLLASEARHHNVYLGLARELAEPATVSARLAELARIEAAILEEPSPRVRLHSGRHAGPPFDHPSMREESDRTWTSRPRT
jgi:tRNA-(ms[2]io[6]A)-hydroxylase